MTIAPFCVYAAPLLKLIVGGDLSFSFLHPSIMRMDKRKIILIEKKVFLILAGFNYYLKRIMAKISAMIQVL